MNHKQLAKLCQKSYEESTFSTMGVDVLYEDTEQSHVFAIRGTQPVLLDLLRNLWLWDKGGAHSGYYNGFLQVEDWITANVSPIVCPGRKFKPCIFTGHSAGGAIALMASRYYLNHDALEVGVVDCVTFGAPRALERQDDERLKSVTTQYIHHRDPVPSWLGHTDYKHVKKHYLGKECGWWRQSLDYHGIDVYEQAIKSPN